jgi:archaellum component FlaC
VFGDDIRMEVKGDLYDRLALPQGGGPGDLTLFQGKLGGGLTPPVGACGINAASSFIAGLSSIANLGQLQEFINNWQSAGTALALYGLATYLPVAKEVLLGANTLSNFVAQLRGFSCSQAMDAIKEFNYQDSFLIKRCIAKKLGISADEVDVKRSSNPDEWYRAYRECLNSASLVDLFGGDKSEAEKYLKLVSPRSLARCYLGVNRAPTSEEIANADLQTRAKYFLYMLLPDVSMDSNGLLRVRTVDIVDTRTGQRRPATVVDVVNIHTEDFERNFNKLIEDLKGVVKYDMDYESALEAVKAPLEEFEEKYGITAQDLAGILILTLKMRDAMEREITANGEVDDKTLKLALMPVDDALSDIKEHFRYRVIERLTLAMYENALRLKEAEEMRKAVGSVATPGDKDGCLVGASTSQ